VIFRSKNKFKNEFYIFLLLKHINSVINYSFKKNQKFLFDSVQCTRCVFRRKFDADGSKTNKAQPIFKLDVIITTCRRERVKMVFFFFGFIKFLLYMISGAFNFQVNLL
jgi:hypothetical protein